MRALLRVTFLLTTFMAGCGSYMKSFPSDANGDVLRRMVADGDDLSKPRGIDFEFVFAERSNAETFAEEVQKAPGLSADLSRYEERKVWEVTVTKHMLPSYEAITALERTLTQLAKSYAGEADGWGNWQVEKLK